MLNRKRINELERKLETSLDSLKSAFQRINCLEGNHFRVINYQTERGLVMETCKHCGKELARYKKEQEQQQ